MSQPFLHIFAPAKINLFLHVTGKRQDGYHLLQSLMVFADVGDDLNFYPAEKLTVETTGPFANAVGSAENNLVYKAAQLLATHYKIEPRAKIVLTKNLPVASGLGGGSSDAAATLKGLQKLWDLPQEGLLDIARQLGADVLACLYKKPLWAEGIGDEIRPMSVPDMHLVLVNPGVATPTPDVFKKFHGKFSAPVTPSTDFISHRNDLTEAAIAVTPIIRDVLSALDQTGAQISRLSGSGATCFGVYSHAHVAAEAAAKLREKYPQWWIVATTA